jgi:hypothetical protein
MTLENPIPEKLLKSFSDNGEKLVYCVDLNFGGSHCKRQCTSWEDMIQYIQNVKNIFPEETLLGFEIAAYLANQKWI